MLFVGAGREAGIRPGDLVGAITGEAGRRPVRPGPTLGDTGTGKEVIAETVHAMSAREYVDRLAAPAAPDAPPDRGPQRFQLADTVDPEVRAALERLRRGE